MQKKPDDLNTQNNDRLIGVISDTHGLLRPEAAMALQGVSLIIHAGDIGRISVLKSLRDIAPVIAVRGNTDREQWAFTLPLSNTAEVGGFSFYVLHDLGRLDLDPAASGFSAVISGHTHEPVVENRNGVLFLNPGSAGPRRFTLPVSVALMRIWNNSLTAELIDLSI